MAAIPGISPQAGGRFPPRDCGGTVVGPRAGPEAGRVLGSALGTSWPSSTHSSKPGLPPVGLALTPGRAVSPGWQTSCFRRDQGAWHGHDDQGRVVARKALAVILDRAKCGETGAGQCALPWLQSLGHDLHVTETQVASGLPRPFVSQTLAKHPALRPKILLGDGPAGEMISCASAGSGSRPAPRIWRAGPEVILTLPCHSSGSLGSPWGRASDPS